MVESHREFLRRGVSKQTRPNACDLGKIKRSDVFVRSKNPVILSLIAAQTFRFSGLEKRTTTGNCPKLEFFLSRSTKITLFGTFGASEIQAELKSVSRCERSRRTPLPYQRRKLAKEVNLPTTKNNTYLYTYQLGVRQS